MQKMLKIIKRLIEVVTGYQITKKNYINGQVCWPGQKQIPQTYFEIENDFHSVYNKAQEVTNMIDSDNPLRRQRHYTLINLLKSTDLNKGDVCEIGCWKGLSSFQMARHIKDINSKTIFHIFDSFEGLSKIKEIDEPSDRNQDKEKLRKQFACSLQVVKNNLKEFNFIKYYKGWVPDRFNELADSVFSFVHVDVDLYQPIYDSIDFFYPRLIKHGVMVFDDYGCTQFPGAKKAIDTYLDKINKPFFVSLPSGQAFLIKNIR